MKAETKTQKSLRNSIAAMATNIFAILIGLVAQAVFVHILGTEYLGINGLFGNIISILAIVELGIGSAIIYNLYKPIAENDIETIKSLMAFYRKAYHIIGLIVGGIGLCLIPFLGWIVGDVTIPVNLTVVYLMFMTDIVLSYFMSYKRSILYAAQRNYVINIIHVLYLFILNATQIAVIYVTKNYYIYLVVKIICRVAENVAINIYVNKNYSYINDRNVQPISKSIEDDIVKKVKALFFHKIGSFIIGGTDNILISKFINVATVGLYSNYFLIIDALNKLFGQALIALTPSVGHLLVENNKEKNYSVFKRIRFINFWIATFAGTGILIVMQPFIKVWIGSKYLLSWFVLVTLVLNFYQKMMRNSYATFKEAAGIYYEDRFVPILESVVNIVTSIIFLKIFGLAGVFMGTIVSGFTLWCYSYPKFVYRKLFNRTYSEYASETLGYVVLFVLIASLSYGVSLLVPAVPPLASVIINILITFLVPNLCIILIFRRSDNYAYFKKLVTKIVHRRRAA